MNIDIDQSPEDDLWYVKYKGGNGEIMTMSEGMESRGNAERSIHDFFASLAHDGAIFNLSIPVTVTDRDNDRDERVIVFNHPAE